MVPNFFGTRDWFCRRHFFHGQCRQNGLGMIQAHYIYWALYFYCYYISSTSDHQALDPGGWGPLLYRASSLGGEWRLIFHWLTQKLHMIRVQPAPGKPPWVLEERPERGWEAQRRGKLCTRSQGRGSLWEGEDSGCPLSISWSSMDYLFTPLKPTWSEDQGGVFLINIETMN